MLTNKLYRLYSCILYVQLNIKNYDIKPYKITNFYWYDICYG